MLTSFSKPELQRTRHASTEGKAMTAAETCFESGGEEPLPGSQPWTMEYVARLFIEGGGFQGIADTHNAALLALSCLDC
jgi:hypothetical protein